MEKLWEGRFVFFAESVFTVFPDANKSGPAAAAADCAPGRTKKRQTADTRIRNSGIRAHPVDMAFFSLDRVCRTGKRAVRHIYTSNLSGRFLPGGFARIFHQRSLTSVIILPNKATATTRTSKVSIGTAIHSATLKTKRIKGATIKAKTQINISAPQPVEKFLKKSANDEFP
ncbi:MAG: hypothetical protein ACOCS6_00570, partial [Desulfosalsimonas sp.]